MTSYTMQTGDILLQHGSSYPSWLHDLAQDDDPVVRELNHIDALAASGDFFVTLATRLDTLAQGMHPESSQQIELEHLVSVLLYLQDNWQLKRLK